MKYCPKCATTKPTSEFHRNKARHDGMADRCKPCAKVRNREYYLATPERNPQRMAHRKKSIAAGREFVRQYLSTHPCVDCGNANFVVLEFDHVRGEKVEAISNMIRRGRSVAVIEAEIKKCEVRCANCHRIVTAERAGWFAGPVPA